MSCIRCGRDTEDNQVFCVECLADMERHPVKPGTPIQLPVRMQQPSAKRTRFRLAESKWTDKIFLLKYIIFWLVVLIVLLGAALALCICMLLQVTPKWINDLLFETAAVSSLFGR